MGNSKIQIILQAQTLSYRLWAKSLLKYVSHGTAKKTKGLPRWACIVRATYL